MLVLAALRLLVTRDESQASSGPVALSTAADGMDFGDDADYVEMMKRARGLTLDDFVSVAQVVFGEAAAFQVASKDIED
jgi:hypothetical protein